MKNHIVHYLVYALFWLLLSGCVSPAIGQPDSINLEGFGIEVGAGYNQLFWEANTIFGEEHNNRTAFSIMPSIRIHYQRSIGSYVTIYSFFGYNEFGGASALDESKAFTNPELEVPSPFYIRGSPSSGRGYHCPSRERTEKT